MKLNKIENGMQKAAESIDQNFQTLTVKPSLVYSGQSPFGATSIVELPVKLSECVEGLTFYFDVLNSGKRINRTITWHYSKYSGVRNTVTFYVVDHGGVIQQKFFNIEENRIIGNASNITTGRENIVVTRIEIR